MDPIHRRGVVLFLMALAPALMTGCGGGGRAPQSASGAVAYATVSSEAATAPVAVGVPVRTAADEAREVVLPDGTVVEADANTDYQIERMEQGPRGWVIAVALQAGAIRLTVPPEAGKEVTVATPVGSCGVRGTEFAVSDEGGEATAVDVFSGAVETGNGSETLTLGPEESGRLTRRELLRQQFRAASRQRWETVRARLADRLIERHHLDLDGETADLDEVLRELPSVLRERYRRQWQEKLQRRREELKAVLEARGGAPGDTRARNRIREAQQRWQAMSPEQRAQVAEQLRRRGAGLTAAADTAAAAGHDTAAARLQERGRQLDNRARQLDEHAGAGAVQPKFTVDVGRAEGDNRSSPLPRSLVSAPAPVLPGDNPLLTGGHRFLYRVQIGPAGGVRAVHFVSGSVSETACRELGKLIHSWRFNAVPGRPLEWRTITITTVAR